MRDPSRWFERHMIVLVVLTVCVLFGCEKESTAPVNQTTMVYVDTAGLPPNSVQDADRNVYSTVLIGTQRWMKENLRTSHFSNGDPIPYEPIATQWATSDAAWTNYNTDASYDELFGKLYNWYAVTDPRNVCPTGWHVPSDIDWIELETFLGISPAELEATGPRGLNTNAGGQLKSELLWNAPNTGANDTTGFSAYAGGYRTPTGQFSNVGTGGFWWSSTESAPERGWLRQLVNYGSGVYRPNSLKEAGASVRCLKD